MNRYQPGEYAASRHSLWRRIFPFLRWWNFIGWDTLRADLLAGVDACRHRAAPGRCLCHDRRSAPGIRLVYIHHHPGRGGPVRVFPAPDFRPDHGHFHRCLQYHQRSGGSGNRQLYPDGADADLSAGVYQLAFGLARLGTLVNFVSHSVVVGFTSGAAILIATSQMKHVLGLAMPRGHSFLNVWVEIAGRLGEINLYVLAVAVITLSGAILFRITIPRWPGMLFAMIIGSLAACPWTQQSWGFPHRPDAGPAATAITAGFFPATLQLLAPRRLPWRCSG